MKRFALAVSLLFVGALAMGADLASDITTHRAATPVLPLAFGPDGTVYPLGVGHPDCAKRPVGVCTSTGPTNHGNIAVDAGSYVVVTNCSAAAWVGAPTTIQADGGNLATCGSRDGGAVFNEACDLVSASGKTQVDTRGTTFNSIGCTSVAGTSVCSVSACVN